MKTFYSFLKKYNQEHLLAFYDELSDEQKKSLIEQIESIDFEEFSSLTKFFFGEECGAKANLENLKPAPYFALPENNGDKNLWAKMYSLGEDALRRGELAAFVVAGGQGTRLGLDAPKGTFKVSPIKEKSLFQIFAEKILRAERKYNVSIPWLVMTSEINHAQTVEFFEKNNFFGLKKENVIFFKQGKMPCCDTLGKIILEEKGNIAFAPDGHGGSLKAICKSNALAELKKRGIKYLSYFQVDNPLINIVDCAFLGFHINANSDLSSKMIPKRDALEKVGLFCKVDDKIKVFEYSDLPKNFQEQRDSNGNLIYVAGSVAIHVFSVDFIEQFAGSSATLKMPFHRADKKIPFVDVSGNKIKPELANGVKFETFVFDALEFAKNPVIIEASRLEEFAPVKNATGEDSPQTCKDAQIKQWATWLKEAGSNIASSPSYDIEISPLFASNKKDFLENFSSIKNSLDITKSFYLE